LWQVKKMYKVGDYVVYPMHGGASVVAVNEGESNGEKTKYYVLKILCSDLVVNVPVDQAERLGLRDVSDRVMLEKLAAVLQKRPDVSKIKTISWNRRQQMYIDRLKTGDILSVAETFKMLWILDAEKRISVGERRLLKTARKILQSEIMLMKKMEEAMVDEWLTMHTK